MKVLVENESEAMASKIEEVGKKLKVAMLQKDRNLRINSILGIVSGLLKENKTKEVVHG